MASRTAMIGNLIKIGITDWIAPPQNSQGSRSSPNFLNEFGLQSVRLNDVPEVFFAREAEMHASLRKSAEQLAEILRGRGCRVVFAESCTAGLVSAALAQIPGISEFHCGSAVVYRLDTKTRWLDVPAKLLVDPGPVSEVVARDMAIGALHKTPEADWSASITGHLGPNAPDGLDGLVFIGVAHRDNSQPDGCEVIVYEHRVVTPLPEESPETSLRERRQISAADLVLQSLLAAIQRG